ncbi:hypothetical protein HH219_15455 [Pseudoalteromonas sp. NEC-BIFX-2020_015]|uniref:hypothetical protein n=1 Tax=Pseudoalteromonas sp. NEC-BIFX-2020_015 TaxID=2729544 RepID=UPI00146131E8|nr:hypothetical protein [Pseudoalteromonas sp. NEC-BIFX-2020_015]NMR26905.1 hypothetical protein [Pseudoalteromonas sp. NEC-BIFX-2020_015]
MCRLLGLLFFFSLNIFACGKEQKEFLPFAVEFEAQSNSLQALREFEILSPIQKGDAFLSNITASVEGEFEVSLDIRESRSYIGDYYQSYVRVANKHIDQIEISLSYNTTKKDRSNMIFCANWKDYKLTELVSFESAKKAPSGPPSPPK